MHENITDPYVWEFEYSLWMDFAFALAILEVKIPLIDIKVMIEDIKEFDMVYIEKIKYLNVLSDEYFLTSFIFEIIIIFEKFKENDENSFFSFLENLSWEHLEVQIKKLTQKEDTYAGFCDIFVAPWRKEKEKGEDVLKRFESLKIILDKNHYTTIFSFLKKYFEEFFHPFYEKNKNILEEKKQMAHQAFYDENKNIRNMLERKNFMEKRYPSMIHEHIQKGILEKKIKFIFLNTIWSFDFKTYDFNTIYCTINASSAVTDFFKAELHKFHSQIAVLTEPTKILLLRVLNQMELNNQQLVQIFDLTVSAVSMNMKQLVSCDYVKVRKEGKYKYYSTNMEKIKEACDNLLSFIGDK